MCTCRGVASAASLAALQLASAAGVTTILTPAPAGPVDSSLAAFVDILVPNEVEAAALTGLDCDDTQVQVIARRLADDWNLRGCVITLGPRGAYVLDRSGDGAFVSRPADGAFANRSGDGGVSRSTDGGCGPAAHRRGSAGSGRELWVAAHSVATVDTVGAGDAFCGSLAASLAAGAALADAVRLANAAGALSTTMHGAATSCPPLTAARALLDAQPVETSPFPAGRHSS